MSRFVEKCGRLGHVNNPLGNFKKAAAAIWRSTLSDADLQALFELYHTAALGSKVCEPTEDAKRAKKKAKLAKLAKLATHTQPLAVGQPLALGQRPLAAI